MQSGQRPAKTPLLGEILLERGLVTTEQLEQALRVQVGGMRRLGSILVRMKVIAAENLTDALSEQLGLPVVNVQEEFRTDVKGLLPRFLCHKYSVLPLSREANNVLRLAMADPLDAVAVAEVENYTGMAVQPVLARLPDIDGRISALVPFSRHDLLNPRVYRAVAGLALAAVAVLLVAFGLRAYRDYLVWIHGTETHVGARVIYYNHDLTVDVDGDGSIYFNGRGAYANGYYGVRFENVRTLVSFVRGASRQFSMEQIDWMNWLLREKLRFTEEPLIAQSG
jgi:hypothetical protein